MEIIEYEDKYLNDVRNLLVELEEYILTIDEDHLDQLHDEYWEKMALKDLEDVKNNDGICYLALENNSVIGLIMGIIPPYEEYDYLDYKCPKKGIISELIVSKECRGSGVGKMLMDKVEEYFIFKGCEYSFVDVFAYNKRGINFYEKAGYHSRMDIKVKKLK